MLPHAQLLARYDEMRQKAQYFGLRREVVGDIVRHVGPSGEGMITYARLEPETAEAVIAAQIADFGPHGLEWVVCTHDAPPDLKERLAAQGFEVEGPEAVLVLDLPAFDLNRLPEVPPSVVRLTRPEQIQDVVRLRRQIWPQVSAGTAERLVQRLRKDPRGISLYAAYVDGQAVSTAQTTFYPGGEYASIGSAATLPAYRGRGLYTALLAARLREAAERGVRLVDSEASPMSRPILEKYGFRQISEMYVCAWEAE